MYRQSAISPPDVPTVNMANFGPLAAEIDWRVLWHSSKFQQLSRLGFVILQRRRSTEANQTLHNVWPSPGLVDSLYIFGGCCPVTKFCQVQNSLCVLQALHSPILAALLHDTRAVGTSQTLRREHSAPPIFCRATITLGIGPHSSLF